MVKGIDVAKKAGVSLTTVSHVISENPSARVNDETRTRVLNAARELNYRPNIWSKMLTQKRVNHIGVALINSEKAYSPGFVEISRGIRNKTESSNYHFIFCPLENRMDTGSAEKLIAMKEEGRIDGFIIDKEDLLDDEALRLVKKRYPLVLMNFSTELLGNRGNIDIYSVGIDHHAGASLAVNHLLELGHRRIAHITREYESIPMGFRKRTDMEILKGYQDSMKNASQKPDPGLVVEGDLFNKTKVYKAVDKLFKLTKPPTAIFAADDNIALMVIGAVSRKGLKVPDDISIVGYNNLFVAEICEPELTTVMTPLCKMGEYSAQTLINIIEGKDCIDGAMLLRPSLVERDSCKIL